MLMAVSGKETLRMALVLSLSSVIGCASSAHQLATALASVASFESNVYKYIIHIHK